MSKVNLYTLEGKENGEAALPKELTAEANNALLAQAIHVYRDRQHKGAAYAKTRAEVNVTKKKIYRQKGTGGARHGAASAPIFVGGGVTHGPKGIKRVLTLPQAQRIKAMKVALTARANEGKVIAVPGLSQITKTSQAKELVKQFKNERLTFVLPEHQQTAARALRNLRNAQVTTIKFVNAYQLVTAGIVVMDSSLVEAEKSAKGRSSSGRKGAKKNA